MRSHNSEGGKENGKPHTWKDAVGERVKFSWEFQRDHDLTLSALKQGWGRLVEHDPKAEGLGEYITKDVRTKFATPAAPGVAWPIFKFRARLIAVLIDLPLETIWRQVATNLPASESGFLDQPIRPKGCQTLSEVLGSVESSSNPSRWLVVAIAACVLVACVIWGVTALSGNGEQKSGKSGEERAERSGSEGVDAENDKGNQNRIPEKENVKPATPADSEYFSGELKAEMLDKIRLLRERADDVISRHPVEKWILIELDAMAANIASIPKQKFRSKLGQIQVYMSVLNRIGKNDWPVYDKFDESLLETLPATEECLYARILLVRGRIQLWRGNAPGFGEAAEREFLAGLKLRCNEFSRAELLFGLAGALAMQKKTQAAIERFDEVIGITGQAMAPREENRANNLLLCNALLGRADAKFQSGNLSLAVNDLKWFFENLPPNRLDDVTLPKGVVIIVNSVWKAGLNSPQQAEIKEIREKVNRAVLTIGEIGHSQSHEKTIKAFLVAVEQNIVDELKMGGDYSRDQWQLAQELLNTPEFAAFIPADIKHNFLVLEFQIRLLSVDSDAGKLEAAASFYRKMSRLPLKSVETSFFSLTALTANVGILELEVRGSMDANIIKEQVQGMQSDLDLITELPLRTKSNIEQCKRKLSEIIALVSEGSDSRKEISYLLDRLENLEIRFVPN